MPSARVLNSVGPPRISLDATVLVPPPAADEPPAPDEPPDLALSLPQALNSRLVAALAAAPVRLENRPETPGETVVRWTRESARSTTTASTATSTPPLTICGKSRWA